MEGELPLRDRLRASRDRPLILGPAPVDVYVTAGPSIDRSHAVVHALRRSADSVVALQRRIVEAGADLVVAPTAGTTAPALHATGQAYRAAALTAAAVDLSRDALLASSGSVSLLGEVTATAGARARGESQIHVERLATSAIDGILVYADDADACRDVVRAASLHRLACIVEVELTHRAMLQEYGKDLLPALVVLRGDDATVLAEALEELRAMLPGVALGARLVVCARTDAFAATGPGDAVQAQITAASTWGKLAPLGLACIGIGGPLALEVMAALADLSSVPRTTIDPPPVAKV